MPILHIGEEERAIEVLYAKEHALEAQFSSKWPRHPTYLTWALHFPPSTWPEWSNSHQHTNNWKSLLKLSNGWVRIQWTRSQKNLNPNPLDPNPLAAAGYMIQSASSHRVISYTIGTGLRWQSDSVKAPLELLPPWLPTRKQTEELQAHVTDIFQRPTFHWLHHWMHNDQNGLLLHWTARAKIECI